MARTQYQSTMEGDAIVSLGGGNRPLANVLPIGLAEAVLRDHRRNAWNYTASSPALANVHLECANDLADALAVAAEQRAKFAEAMQPKAEAA